MSHVVRPVIAHFFKNSFQLFEVGRLFITNYIDGFGKIISTFTVEGSSQVTCDVECCTIWFFDEGWVFDTVFFKVNHLGTLRFLEKSFLCQNVYDFIHLIIVESFTIVAIKWNTKFIVETVEFH